MKSDFPTEDTIREYLLGRLDDQNDLERRLSEQMLFNDELWEIVDSIEDEIIEDYLDGTLSAGDQATIEGYFLRPAERKEKLQFARFLRDHFEMTGHAITKKKLDVPRKSLSNIHKSTGVLPFRWVFQFRTWCELAALVLLITSSLIYVSGVRHRLQSQLKATQNTQTRLEGELAQERERFANVTKQLQDLESPTAILTFLGPVFRADGGIPVVDIRPWTQRIRVELDLQGAPPGDYDVRLETKAGRPIWSQSRLTASSGDMRFEMPAQSLSTGAYCLVVSSRPKSYCFRVRDKVD